MEVSFKRRTLIFAFFLLPCRLPLYADSLAENQARFGQIKGTVQILTQGVSHWLDAHVDLPLEVGDQIHVDEDSEAELSMTKNALWVLQPNTDVIIGHTTTQEGLLTLTQGTLLGKFESANNGKTGTWTFNTPAGVCAVRGTEFAINYTSEGGTHLAVWKGVVELQASETATQSFPFVPVGTHQEGALHRGENVKVSGTFSSAITPVLERVKPLQKRYLELFNTWSPLTVEYRKMLRAKYVPPIEKSKKQRSTKSQRTQVRH